MTIGRRTKGVAGLATLGLVLAVLAGCTPSHPQSTFDTLGPVSQSQANLFWVLFWIGSFVFVAVTGALIYMAIRFRRREGDGDPEQVHGHSKLEIAWTIAPTLLLAAIAVPSVLTIFDNANSPLPPADGGLLVEVTGHQWWFEFEYPEYEIATANELHIPVGEPINFALDSVDVIHSFWVPKLAGKVDMIPNNDNTMWFQAREPGEYLGQCAEFCGVSHADMRVKVIAHTRDDFDAWVAAQQAPAVEPTDPLAQAGKEIFFSTEAGCRGCHTIDGTNARGQIGPNLTHFASRGEFAGGTLENSQHNLRAWLEDPENMKPANKMGRDAVVYNDPNRALTEPEISALIAYLRALQ